MSNNVYFSYLLYPGIYQSYKAHRKCPNAAGIFPNATTVCRCGRYRLPSILLSPLLRFRNKRRLDLDESNIRACNMQYATSEQCNHLPFSHLPVISIIPFQLRPLPPFAVGVRSRAIEIAVLSAGDDVHP